jgi:hypothetical protein
MQARQVVAGCDCSEVPHAAACQPQTIIDILTCEVYAFALERPCLMGSWSQKTFSRSMCVSVWQVLAMPEGGEGACRCFEYWSGQSKFLQEVLIMALAHVAVCIQELERPRQGCKLLHAACVHVLW